MNYSGMHEIFEELFHYLDAVGYLWQPLIPEQITRFRQEKNHFNKIKEYFGLGVSMAPAELKQEGISPFLIQNLQNLSLAVSRTANFYIPHNHWPSRPETADQYVHFGHESILLLNQLYRYWDLFRGKRVLEIGSGGGGLSFELGEVSHEVLGIDRSCRAVEWATASAMVQHSKNVHFSHLEIGVLGSEAAVGFGTWDWVVFNPPMGITKKTQYLPHRDGGPSGMELPLRFLDFSVKCLKPGGGVACLMTNPISRGKSLLFEELRLRKWIIQDQVCLNRRFNWQLYKEDLYQDRDIDCVELYFLLLKI